MFINVHLRLNGTSTVRNLCGGSLMLWRSLMYITYPVMSWSESTYALKRVAYTYGTQRDVNEGVLRKLYRVRAVPICHGTLSSTIKICMPHLQFASKRVR